MWTTYKFQATCKYSRKIISDDKKTSVENQRKLNIDNKKKNHSNKPIMIIGIIAIITLAGVILFQLF